MKTITKEFFSLREVAKKLGVDYQTVVKLVARREIKAHDFSTGVKPYYKISAESLQEFVEGREV